MALYGSGDSFWQIVWSAEWLATVGLPLAITVASLGVAYLLVRGQLRHDRALAVAQRRAEAATRLGTGLIDLQRRFDETAPADPWYAQAEWPDDGAVYRLVDEAHIVLDEEAVFAYAGDVARCVTWGWQACHRRRREMQGVAGAPTPIDFANALGDTLLPHTERLHDLGKHLIRWDGHGAVPVAGLEDFERMPPWRSDAFHAWCDAFADEFQERALRFAAPRAKPSRVKRPSSGR